MRVLILDEGLERSSVAAARALAAAGWTVGSASVSPNLASRCRAVSSWHRIVSAEEPEPFVARVGEIVAEHGYEAAFASWEGAVLALSERRDSLACGLGYGPHEGLLRAIDKERMTAAAESAGLSAPRTFPPSRDALQGISGPVVIKPASPLVSGVRNAIFEDAGEAVRHVERIELAGGRAIAQEYVQGRLIAVSLVAGESGIVSICQQLATKVWPVPVGVTARGESVAVDPDLRERIEALLEALQWRGLAQLQFLVPADGRPRILDFNPRFYGSLALAVSAGANHPDAWARIATGRPVTPMIGRPGARYQWFSRDLRATLAAREGPHELVRMAIGPIDATHSVWSRQEPQLAVRFLAEQALRASRRAIARERRQPRTDEQRSACLHELPPTPEVCGALRTRPVPSPPRRVAERLLMKAGRLSFEDGWLGELHSARRAASGEAGPAAPRILVRVDEFPYYSGLDEPKFGLQASWGFHGVMAEEGIPHLMSVLPQWTRAPLDPAGSGGRPLDEHDRELLDRMRADGVTFAQHGHTHRTRFADPRRHSELCGLGDAELTELLEQGAAKLAEVDVHPRILVPPFNRFDARQWPVLAGRYDIVTGGPESVMLLGFHGGPLWRGEAVYYPSYAPLYGKAAEILPVIDRLLEAGVGGWIPVTLHMGWEVDDGFAALRRLAKRIAPYVASWDELLDRVDGCRRL